MYHIRFDLRNRHFILLDILFFSLTPYLALVLRLDTFRVPASFVPGLAAYTVSAVVVRLVIFYWFGLYRRFWRYASVDELIQLGMAAGLAMVVITSLLFIWRSVFPFFTFARSVLIIDGLLAFLAAGSTRFSVRMSELRHRRHPARGSKRVLIVGAGDAGAALVRELQRNLHRGFIPVAFVDDDDAKHHVRIHGVPVLGSLDEVPGIVSSDAIDEVIIAIPTVSGNVIRSVVASCERLGVKSRILPAYHELLDGAISINHLRDVDIEDLLRREPVLTDTAAVGSLIAGKRVLITGGGGSIGGELCRQVMWCRPDEVILLGHGENSIFEIYQELRAAAGRSTMITPIIADTRFSERINSIFLRCRPHIVFHAAAHKHVPLMELNPVEAFTNNVVGTRNVIDAAWMVGVEHFVMISTDKAVNPTSVMGASKRAAELLVHQAAKKSGKPYVAVRFGNVLGSRGSVVLTFKKQIAAGGPVTVTDSEMRRFFMTIPEAVQLVLQAAVLGQGGEIFVLDMGEQIKVLDLARDLIELSGLEIGRDIEIEFTGLRPGEKLYEELFVPGEQYHRTRHEKIFIAGNASKFVPDGLDSDLDVMVTAAQRNDAAAIIRGLRRLLPEYDPENGRAAEDMGAGETKETGTLIPLVPSARDSQLHRPAQ